METGLSDIDFQALCGRKFFPSPGAWEDQVFYFLLLDRFSDGKENGFRNNDGKTVTTGSTALFQPTDNGNAVTSEAQASVARGGRQVGWGKPARVNRQDRISEAPGCDGNLGKPCVQASLVSANLSRLRHPELPRRRSPFRHARRPQEHG